MVTWSRYNPDELARAERKLVEYSGVEITSRMIPINNCNYLHCLNSGDKSLPPLVLLHGYGGSGLIFYKLIKDLSSRYYLYIVDHLGMGRSTRPVFQANSVETAENFFVESIEQFRVYVGLESFVLAGHSFGGYIAGCYTLKYPNCVQKLLFLSAVGIPTAPPEFDFIKDLKGDWKFRWIQKLLMFLWVRNITPASIMRYLGPFSHKFAEFMVGDRITSLNIEEKAVIKTYLEQINLLPGSGEYGLAYILYPGAWARNPLCNRINSLKVPMAFYYGDNDWLKPDGAEQVQQKAVGQVLIFTITNSDHHLYWDNPKELVEKIFEALDKLQ